MNNNELRDQPVSSNTNNIDNSVCLPSNKPAKRNSFSLSGVIICILMAAITGLVGFAVGTRLPGASINQPDYAELNEVYNALSQKYDGKLDKSKLIQGAAAGMVTAAGDDYTTFLTSDDAKDLEDDLSGSFDGVGIEIGHNKDDQLSVISVLDGGSAKEAGIQAGDIIASVNGETSINWTAVKAAGVIRGKAGTTVKLSILRGSETKEFSLTRRTITDPSVKWEVKDNIGYIRMSRFGDDTADLAKKAATDLKSKGVKGIILDLRGNGGGYVDAAQAVASLWLDQGQVVVQEKSGDVVRDTVKATGGNVLKGTPTVVLIDGGSASASEIVAGALRDNGVAKLVGAKSYGKGSVQELVDLSGGNKLKVTVAKWYTPKGSNIDKTGIEPDEKVDMTAEQYNAGNDTQRNRAIELLNK